jgi:hypothetical protein
LNNLLLIFLLLLPAGDVHKFYVGLTDITYSEKSETYQITQKLFTDDLEKAIEEKTGKDLKLGTKEEMAEADTVVFDYVLDKLSIRESKKPLKLTVIGRETELDVTWLYLETAKMEPAGTLTVRNEMLMEIFDDQVHVLKLSQGGKTLSTVLNYSERQETLSP